MDAQLVAATACVLCGGLIIRKFTAGLDPFEPLVMFALAWFVMFVVRPGAMINNGDLIFDTGISQTDLRATFPLMLTLGLLGALGFLVGYLSPLGSAFASRWSAPSEDVAPDVLVTYAVVLAGVGLVLFVLFLRTSHTGLSAFIAGRSLSLTEARLASTSYFWQGPYLWIPASLIMLEYGRRTKHSMITAVGVLLAAMLVLRSIALGDRLLLLPLVGGLFVLHYIRRHRRPGLPTIVSVLVIALIGSSTIADLRNASVRENDSIATVAAKDLVSPTRWWGSLTAHPDSGEAPALAVALTVVPREIPFTYGMSTIGDVASRPIPRRIWAGKPVAPKDRVIAAAFPVEHQLGIANPEFTCLLTFYMDAGPWACFVGMILYGIIGRAIYEYYRRFRSAMLAQILLALSFALTAMAARDGFTDTVDRSALIIGPVILAFWIFNREAATEVAPAHAVGGVSRAR